MVPHVEHDDVVARAEKLPERQIAVDREPVAVTRENAHAGIRVAVAAHHDLCPVGHRQIDNVDGFGDFEIAQRTILPVRPDLAGGAFYTQTAPGGQTAQVVTERKFSLSFRS